MIKEAVYVGVDVAKNSLNVAVSNSEEVRQFTNDHEGITKTVQYIAGLKPSGVIVEATGHLEMSLVAALQADHLPVAVINPRQVHDIFKPLDGDAEATYKAGVQFAVEQCNELLEGGAPRLHFYTLNKVDPTREILNKIKR